MKRKPKKFGKRFIHVISPDKNDKIEVYAYSNYDDRHQRAFLVIAERDLAQDNEIWLSTRQVPAVIRALENVLKKVRAE